MSPQISTGGMRLRSPRLPSVVGNKTIAPFTGGMVTDLDPAHLTPTQSPYLQDVIFPTGVAGLRGAPVAAGALNTTGVGIGGIAVTDEIPPAATGAVYYYGYTDGRIGNSLGANLANGVTSVQRIPYVVFQNEILWFPQDGISPIVRTPAQPLGSGLTATGTITAAIGQTAITGVGTTFTAWNGQSCYVDIGNGNPPKNYLVVRAGSDTFVSVTTPMAIALAGVSFSTSPWGYIGLCTQVSDVGTCQDTAGAVVGTGTYWTQPGPGFGAVVSGDLICPKGAAGAGQFSGVVSVGGDGTITASGGTWTQLPYRIQRPLVGTHGCMHNGRLIVVGCAWQRRRVYYTPLASSTQVAGMGEVPWTLGDPTNGNLSFATQPGDANVCPYVDVPDANAEGRVVGVASTASGILVLATDGAYLISGDFPNETVVNLASDADCVDARSIVVAKGSVFWAGQNGIFQFTGGRVVDITAGKRNNEWRTVVAAAGGATAILPAYFVKNHYCVGIGSPWDVTWVYDAAHAVWCGNHTTTALCAYTMSDQDEAYIVPNVVVASQRATKTSAVFIDSSVSDSGAEFVADLPPIAAGDAVTDKRVTAALISLSATVGGTVTVMSVIDGSEGPGVNPVYGSDGTITGNGIYSPVTTRIRPNTDATQSPTGAIGVKGRKFQMRITFTNAASTSVKIYEIALFARTFAEGR